QDSRKEQWFSRAVARRTKALARVRSKRPGIPSDRRWNEPASYWSGREVATTADFCVTRADVSTAWPDFTPTMIVDTTSMPVRDQGARGTCLAFAASAAHEHCRAPGNPLSPEY